MQSILVVFLEICFFFRFNLMGMETHLFEFGNLFLREHREHIWTGTLCASWWGAGWFWRLTGWTWWWFWCSRWGSCWGGSWSFLWSSFDGGISFLGLLLLYLLLFLRLRKQKRKKWTKSVWRYNFGRFKASLMWKIEKFSWAERKKSWYFLLCFQPTLFVHL